MNVRAEVEELYTKHYAKLKLADKRVLALKDVITAALKAEGKPHAAVKKWALRKGVDLTGVTDYEEKTAKPVVEGGTVPSKLDRKSLKATLFVLRDAGIKVKYDKEESSEQLAARLNNALQAVPSPEMLEKLEKIDPTKLKVLNGDGACLGLFVDLKQPECQVCEDRDACIRQYLKNLDGNLKMFKDAMIDSETESVAKTVTEETAEAMKKQKSTAPVKRMKYDKEMAIYIMDVANPINKKKESDAYDMVQEVLDKVPSTLGELRKLVNSHFQYDSDRDFMEELFTQLLDYGIVKRWDDLDKDEKKAYKKALAAASSEADEEDEEENDDEDTDDEEDDDE